MLLTQQVGVALYISAHLASPQGAVHRCRESQTKHATDKGFLVAGLFVLLHVLRIESFARNTYGSGLHGFTRNREKVLSFQRFPLHAAG